MLGIDMGAISESLFESELFGHERGAFTDAYESRPGKFEAANGSFPLYGRNRKPFHCTASQTIDCTTEPECHPNRK